MAGTSKKEDKIGKKLLMKDENGWNRLTAADKRQLTSFCEEYKEFLSAAKTERACHDHGLELAQAQSYTDLAKHVKTGKKLGQGAKVYLSGAGKTLILARLGKRPVTDGLRIIGGHTDAPRLDLKPRPVYEEGGMALLDTHYYGGLKKYQWVTMPLAIHGVIVKKNGKTVHVSIGEALDEPVFTITDLLPHLGKEQAGKKMSEAITGEGLNVLLGSIPVPGKEGKEDSNAIKRHVLKLLN